LSGPGAVDQYLEAIGLLQSDLTPSNIERPIELLQNLIGAEGDSARLQAALAQAYLRKIKIKGEGEDEAKLVTNAFEACERAIRMDPQAVEVQVTRGLALTYLDRLPEAIDSFKLALERSPNDMEALLGLAGALHLQNELKEAEKIYLQAVEKLPDYWGSHNELGGYYYDVGEYALALNEWRKVTELNPNGPNPYINVGNAYFKLGKYEEAREAYQHSLAKEKTDNGYIGLGTAQFYLHQYTSAADSFKAAIELYPKSAMVWANLGDAYRQIPGEEQAALTAYDQAIQLRLDRNPGARGLARIAELYAKRSALPSGDQRISAVDAQKAINYIMTALRMDAEKLEIIADAITVFHLIGDRDKALRYLDLALENKYSPAQLQDNPELTELRLDPRYQEIIKKYQQ
jgi:tetratricopeptide (TPR) repeat protein